jgi:hypothetical protein
MRDWTANKIATILRTFAKYLLPEWTIRPYCDLWPTNRSKSCPVVHRATGNLPTYTPRSLLITGIYIVRPKKKDNLYKRTTRSKLVAYYLCTADA